jgi:hypothetical protein
MENKTNIELVDEQKYLYEWAEAESEFSEGNGQVSAFLYFSKREGKDATEMMSYTEYLVLKEKFLKDE